MHSSPQQVVPDPTRIIELPVHLRPTTIASSPALLFGRPRLPPSDEPKTIRHAGIPASLPAPATLTTNGTNTATPSSSSNKETSEAFALLRRVYLQRDLTGAIAELQSGLGDLLGGRAVLVLFDARDQPWSPIAEDLQAAVGVAGVEAIRAAATQRRIIMSPDGRGFAAPTSLARTAAIVAWRGPSAPTLEAHLGPTIGAIASRLGVLDHFLADHEANLRVATEVKARITATGTTTPARRSSPKWTLLAFGAMLSIALGLVISAALIQVPSYSRGRVVIRMPSANVVAPTDGTVKEWLVVTNQRVHAGEPIARLDATRELKALADADATYRAAMGAYLADPEDVAMRGELVRAAMKRDAAKDKLAERSLYASIDGVVRSTSSADEVKSGETVATIVPDGGEPTAMAFMPSSDAERIKPGMTLQMSITGYDRISVAVTDVEPSASFVRVKARLPKTSFISAGTTYELHDGQAGLGEIEVATKSFLSVIVGGDQ